jgi:hypothetical protein
MKKRFTNGLPFVLLIFAGLSLCGLPAAGRNYFITDTNDTWGATSLRWAIMDANRHGGNNIIILGAQPASGRQNAGSPPRTCVYHLTKRGADEDAARTGDLDITRGNLIIASVKTNAVIDASGLGDRVFQVFPHVTLTLENLVITGGAPGAGSDIFASGEPGGGILNEGNLLMGNCVITNNSSGAGKNVMGNGGGTSGGDGGGIYNSGRLTMENCLLAGNSAGNGVDGVFGGNGGGIRNDGDCKLVNCIIGMNRSGTGGRAANIFGWGGSGGNGGGIYNFGTMQLHGCNVGANATAGGDDGGNATGMVTIYFAGGPGGRAGNGAGIYNAGFLDADSCAIHSNRTGRGGDGGSFGGGGNSSDGGSGAGIYNVGSLIMTSSTVSGNICGDGGNGGSGFFGASDGGAGGNGGGIYNVRSASLPIPGPLNSYGGSSGHFRGSLFLTACTIALNQTGAGGDGGNNEIAFPAALGGQGGDGGGVLNDADPTNVVIRNTLIALNFVNTGGHGGTNMNQSFTITWPGQPTNTPTVGDAGADGIGFDIGGGCTSQGYNLISVAEGSSGMTNHVNADQVGSIASPIDPHLGPLQMNGGFTPTHALLSGSPAIDQGNSFSFRTDQRGQRRPYDFPGFSNAPGGDGADIGAFESNPN